MNSTGRLLSINNYYYRRSGAEVVFFGHNELFGRHGWDVVPFSMHHPNNLASEFAPYFVDEIEYGESYSPLGALTRAAKVIYSTESRRKLRALLKGRSVSLAHCHCIYHHISPSILGTLQDLHIPVVMTLHDLKIACPAYFMHRNAIPCNACRGGHFHPVVRHRCIKGSLALSAVVYLESTLHKLLGSYTDKVQAYVSPSRFYIDLMIDWGYPAELFHHVPNFMDVTGLPRNQQIGAHFGYVGRLSKEKGVHLLIEAAAVAKVPIKIAGDGPERETLQRLAQEREADVEFVGVLDRDSVLDFMAACRATVVPSIWYENCPMTVLESFAACTPVIGAAIGGVPELVEAGTHGGLFEAGNVPALARQLEAFAGMSEAALVAMGQTARDRAEEFYSPERYYSAMQAVYDRVRH
jgi:glycosyltransferase involved in cell wall biosynthesis